MSLNPDRAQQLAGDYESWSRELNRHWAAEDGSCVCGAPVSPCVGETTARRKLVRAEAEWRAEARRVAGTPADTSGAPGGAAQHDNRPAPSNPRRWT